MTISLVNLFGSIFIIVNVLFLRFVFSKYIIFMRENKTNSKMLKTKINLNILRVFFLSMIIVLSKLIKCDLGFSCSVYYKTGLNFKKDWPKLLKSKFFRKLK